MSENENAPADTVEGQVEKTVTLPVWRSVDYLPSPYEVVIIAGGIGWWTGQRWESRVAGSEGRKIEWKVNWWIPLIREIKSPSLPTVTEAQKEEVQAATDHEGLLQCRALLKVQDGDNLYDAIKRLLERPRDVEPNTVQVPMELPEWFNELKAMDFPRGPFEWKQNYGMCDDTYHWAINDPSSEEHGRVSDCYTVLLADYPNACDGKAVSEQRMPKLITAALNAIPNLLALVEKLNLSLNGPKSSSVSGFPKPDLDLEASATLKVPEMEVLPCPFCGGAAAIEHGFAQHDKTMGYDLFFAEVACNNRVLCNARVSQFLNDEPAAIRNVVRQWNKRAAPSAEPQQPKSASASEFSQTEWTYARVYKLLRGKDCASEPGVTIHPLVDEINAALSGGRNALNLQMALADLRQIALTLPTDWFFEHNRRASHALSNAIDALQSAQAASDGEDKKQNLGERGDVR